MQQTTEIEVFINNCNEVNIMDKTISDEIHIFIKEGKQLKKLEYKNQRRKRWKEKIHKFLKNNFGEKSDYFQHWDYLFYKRRAVTNSAMTDVDHQRDSDERMDEYIDYLKIILEES